ncbi:MAG: HEAT repeat domain-containing protein [Anaerolineae bacterium]|nr:HEAT repeat domain-containing protein [Anaerolineae bacterium]MDW8171147.1 HEAT repeat domain-containing protein [Anaerolineae bacterium]
MADPYPDQLNSILSELRDVNKEKRRLAVMKLGMLGGDEAIRALIRLVENDHEDLIVRGRAAMMLGKVGDARAVEPLIRALEAPGYQTPLNAVESLGLLGDTRAIEALMAILPSSKDKLRDATLTALKRLGCDTDALNQALTSDKKAPEPER